MCSTLSEMTVLYRYISLLCYLIIVVSAEYKDCPSEAPSGCKCDTQNGVHCIEENNITEIPSWLPRNTTYLAFLTCNIRSLNRDSFKNLVNLEVVNILNKDHSLTFNDSLVFQGLKSLYKVDVQNSGIVSLPPRLFAGLPRLKRVTLDHNPLTSLPDDLFKNSLNLQYLYLEGTRLNRDVITKIGQGYFGKNIESLSISKTVVQDLKDVFFSGLPKLNTLGTSNCGIKSIGADILNGTQVNSVTFDGNPLEFIDENAFRGSKILAFECIGCQLTSNVTFNGFLRRMTLHRIYLQDNQLNFVPKDAFVDQKDLREIDLSKNSIATIEENAYANLPKCKDTRCLKLNDNPLNCDCNLAWFRSFADIIKGNKDDWKCDRPQNVSEKSLISLKVSEFICVKKAKTTPKPTALNTEQKTNGGKLRSAKQPSLSTIWPSNDGTARTTSKTETFNTVKPTNAGTFSPICITSVVFVIVVHIILT